MSKSVRAKESAVSILGPPEQAIAVTETKEETPARANWASKSRIGPPEQDLLDTIRTLGELLDDLELVRIMNGNRISALERDYGEALPHLDVVQRQLRAVEHLAELELVRAWRGHPLATWAKETRGVGEKSIARLVAAIGDPSERPNVAKLWAYCGHGDPARGQKRKGMTQEELFKQGNPRAKKQVWLIATAMLKSGNREVYDARRKATSERNHVRACNRCGPAGHPALPGSPWSDGHKHADALRVAGKEFLKELWLAGRVTDVTKAKDHKPVPPITVPESICLTPGRATEIPKPKGHSPAPADQA